MPINRWMDKENMVHVHNGALFYHKEKWNPVICNKMGGTRGHYGQWNKPDTESKELYIFYHILKLKKVHLEVE
jgi:hypothetical protein